MEIGRSDSGGSGASTARPSSRSAERIVASLEAAAVPATAQEVYADLRAHGERTGLATIYRALHALEDRGVVHAIRRRDELAYRTCGGEEHDHLVCEECGAVAEVPRDRLKDWFRRAAPDHVPASAPQQIGSVCARVQSDQDG